MGMSSYTQNLPGVMKLLNKYITDSGKNRRFIKTSGREHMEVGFTKTQEKDENDKVKNSKGYSHCFYFTKKYQWAEACPGLEH